MKNFDDVMEIMRNRQSNRIEIRQERGDESRQFYCDVTPFWCRYTFDEIFFHFDFDL